MASIKDAFEETLGDNLSIIKFILLAIPVYYSYHLYMTSKDDLSTFWITAGITFILLFGFLIKCTTNVMNGKDYVLPSFNIFAILWASVKGLLAIGPSIAINTYLAIFITSRIALPVEWIDSTLKIVVCAIFTSIMLTSFVLYTKHQKITDAYNFKIISQSCIDILIAVLFMIPGIALINIALVGFISYVMWVFLGIESPVLIFFWCISLVINLGIIGDYLAQVEYENIKEQ